MVPSLYVEKLLSVTGLADSRKISQVHARECRSFARAAGTAKRVFPTQHGTGIARWLRRAKTDL